MLGVVYLYLNTFAFKGFAFEPITSICIKIHCNVFNSIYYAMHPYGAHVRDCYDKSWHGRQCIVGDNTGNNIKQPFIPQKKNVINLFANVFSHTYCYSE